MTKSRFSENRDKLVNLCCRRGMLASVATKRTLFSRGVQLVANRRFRNRMNIGFRDSEFLARELKRTVVLNSVAKLLLRKLASRLNAKFRKVLQSSFCNVLIYRRIFFLAYSKVLQSSCKPRAEQVYLIMPRRSRTKGAKPLKFVPASAM